MDIVIKEFTDALAEALEFELKYGNKKPEQLFKLLHEVGLKTIEVRKKYGKTHLLNQMLHPLILLRKNLYSIAVANQIKRHNNFEI